MLNFAHRSVRSARSAKLFIVKNSNIHCDFLVFNLDFNYFLISLTAESFITNSDLNFIGCWWLPFLIYGIVTILFSIPMFFFPKHMRQYNINKLET